MAYTALYRKYRPGEFDEVKGQDHIVKTLKNQISANRVGHAYLFCGTRGTGKTSVAKIFAKAVNCENPVDGSPCGECAACRAIAAGSSMNVIEIDAASNNGVDNIRQIREEVAYSPAEGKYKVYIIDEVHMLSIGAFNALLKTLEEPPSYVIFILATTEAHKVPVTILSRCQRYDFHRITIDTIAARLQELLDNEGVVAEEKAVRYIAKAADGSMRDALSLMDQCIAFYLGEDLTYDHVLEVLGAVDTDVFGRLLSYILKSNVAGAISVLEEMTVKGRELSQFVSDFTWYLRNLLLMQASEHMEDVIDMSTENLQILKQAASEVPSEVIMRYIRVLSDLSNQLRLASQKRVLIEIALIRMCKPEMEATQDSLIDRIAHIEREIKNGIVVSGTVQTTDAAPVEKKPKKVIEAAAVPEDVKNIIKNWQTILRTLGQPFTSALGNVTKSLGNEGQLLLVFTDGTPYEMLTNENHKQIIQDTIDNFIGKKVRIDYKMYDDGEDESDYPDLSSIINMELEIEEE